jgi:hypothetical protein
MAEYNIPWKNVHNMDEKGFQMGHIRGTWVMFSKELSPPQAPSTGISNWVSIAECVNAEGGSIPPIVRPGSACLGDRPKRLGVLRHYDAESGTNSIYACHISQDHDTYGYPY